jgi:phosphatidylglycerol---prolipoprotein diacylglyceryl transferase
VPYHPIEMFRLGPVHLRTWGTMVGLGIFAGAWLTVFLARRRSLPAEKMWTLAAVVIAAGILGGRVSWALQPSVLGDTLRRPWVVLQVWEGGLALIGGLVFAVGAGIWYARRVGLAVLPTADLVAPGLGLGIAIGRIGCFLTGLHPGRPTSLPWGIQYLGAVRHPIPLYESIVGLALVALGLLLLRRRPASGVVAVAVGGVYLVARSLLDLLRAPVGVPGADPRFVGGLTLTQALSLVLVPLLGMMVVFLMRRARRTALA